MMPQNPDLIGVISEDGSVVAFDKTKHASHESEFKGEITCEGHREEGFGLSWNHQREGSLLTGAMDSQLKVWDITKFQRGQTLKPHESRDNGIAVNDVEWCSTHDSVFISGDEGSTVGLWDLRQTGVTRSGASHNGGVNSVSWNKQNQFCVASGDGDGLVNIWDVRSFQEPVKAINAHEGSVSSVEWNPSHGHILATGGGDDAVVKLWDLSQDDSLRFKHCGHLLGVNDVAWNSHEPWMLASVSNDNTLHIWQPSLSAMA